MILIANLILTGSSLDTAADRTCRRSLAVLPRHLRILRRQIIIGFEFADWLLVQK
jgi:hypothetical protein